MPEKSAERGIVTGGTWCLDNNKTIAFWPPEDAAIPILAVERRGGGSGCNLAVDVRKLDPAMPVETIGLVGDDEAGRLLLAEADQHGIGRSQLKILAGNATQTTDAFCSRKSGRRTHIYEEGVAVLLTPDHFDLERVAGRIFHLGLPGAHRLMDGPWKGDPNGWVTVLRRARAAGFATNLELMSIGAARIAELSKPCLPHLDFLVVNDFEIGAIAGVDTLRDGETDLDACIAAVRNVLALGAMRLVAVHFTMGAIVVERSGAVTHRPSVNVDSAKIVGANGAGDAFAAGFIYGLHEDWSIADALRLAHAAAAASLRSTATTDSVESWQACLDLAESWGWR